MWRKATTPDPVFTDTLELDMGEAGPSLAGPKRPQDRVLLDLAKPGFAESILPRSRLSLPMHLPGRCRLNRAGFPGGSNS
ncbi:hypothetical protein [Methylobacterium brachythecii]|uniref:Aconitase A n=1 Tax=Methylobacterium brachythecii TaxID=1176177 RepID=A0A7W6F9D6_9HYPH|nr:hypothetical protein [Methylobacterium brachythecii]MBB3905407.1 aconitase A [Methylobacterium brachythecii]GLS44887.1 hypothetical protein GCM10007884_28760 [Methylobacterium brachythecii]